MKILFRKLSDEQHTLEIVRDNGAREQVTCETRSHLVHDFLHYAVEAEAALTGGFWGNLARGTTLAQMSDQMPGALGTAAPEMAAIEQVVDALTGAVKGRSAAEMVAGLRRYAASLGGTMPGTMPDWLTEEFVAAVQERMRQLLGRWRAPPFGSAMDLDW